VGVHRSGAQILDRRNARSERMVSTGRAGEKEERREVGPETSSG
jgi:hypothetical protein